MNSSTQSPWTPLSWKSKPINQQAEYPDPIALEQELEKLKLLPPIVPPKEINNLRKQLEEIYNREGFIIQVGDCAERFDDCNHEITKSKVMLYDLLGNLFSKLTNTPSIVIGRMAGQYAKPRTEAYEIIDGKKVLNFKGENINGLEIHDRVPDPKRMTEGYFKSVAIVNYIKQLKETTLVCPKFNEKIKVLRAQGAQEEDESNFHQILNYLPNEEDIKINRDVFISHEALLLNYEDSQVKKENDKYYCLSAHFLWIGMRTNDVEGAHVEFFRGLENPLGVKISKDIANSQENLEKLVRMIKVLNPENKEGKLSLITRIGARYVEDTLPKILKAVMDEGLKVLWLVDGVHGNTQKLGGYKTRKFEDVKEEILTTFKVFDELGARLHGIHLEITPDEVTECVGGLYSQVKEHDLGKNYTTYCDPRLNFNQSVELIYEIGKEINLEHRNKDRKNAEESREN